ncbi:sugar transferase [Desulfococcaceae bacterium HSG7]|nr:sugar transferase [Desulfococcaceae bacterium HSG7]
MKRAIDLVLTIPAYFLLAPLMIIIAGIIHLTMGKPVFFRQIRPGFHGNPFTIYKFRTMRNAYDKNGYLLPDSERLTRFGKFFRSASLDELPELLNIIKGEMSIVGPRPLLMQYLERYSPEQARRHEVRPGLTGWAQINGRNALTWEEKFRLDVWYADHQSVWLDIKIILMTMLKVLKREGISQPGQVTMEEFKGIEVIYE